MGEGATCTPLGRTGEPDSIYPRAQVAGDFQLRFNDTADFQRAWEASLHRGDTFVPTEETPELGASVRVRVIVPPVGEATLEGEVTSLEVDEHDRSGLRVSFAAAAREALRQLAAKATRPAPAPRASAPPPPRASAPPASAASPPLGEATSPDVAAASSAPQGPIAPGQVLGGRFRIEALIGEGGMGEVYRATHVYLKRPVALKTLQKKLLSDADAWARFQREAELVSQLESPNVVRVFDFGRFDDGQPFISMELVDGPGLDRVIAQGPLPPDKAVALLEQVGEGLAEAHALGIVHRDLKPPNIMLGKRRDGRTQAKILDFGIARLAGAESMEQLTAAGVVVGTPAYLAPEQALGTTVDARTDIYSLGCVAYAVLTGRPPFRAPAIGQLLLMQLNEAPRPLDAYNPALAEWPGLSAAILKALEKKPEHRWQTVKEFTAALRAGLSRGGPPSAGDVHTGDFPVEWLPAEVEVDLRTGVLNSSSTPSPSGLTPSPSTPSGLRAPKPSGATPRPGTPRPGLTPQPFSRGAGLTPQPSAPRSGPSGLTPQPFSRDAGLTPQPSAPRSGPSGLAPQPFSRDAGLTPQPSAPRISPSGLTPAPTPRPSVPRVTAATARQPSVPGPVPSSPSGLLSPSPSAPWPSSPSGFSAPRASAHLPPPPRMTPPGVDGPVSNAAMQGQLGRLGETLAHLGFALAPERVAAMETARASIPEVATVAWALVAEPMRTTHTQPAFASLLGLAVDVARAWDGALDRVDEKSFTFLFTGSSAQARAVLAAQELRERIEVVMDGAPTDVPVFRLSLNGGRLTPPADAPAEGDVVRTAVELAGRAGPGQVLLPASFASAVSDLVETQPAGDAVAIADRRPFPVKPLPVVGREPLVALIAERLAALQQGPAPALVVVGPPLSGRSTMAQEVITRARAQGYVVGHAQGSAELAGVPYAALAEVLCQLCNVVPSQRHTALEPVLAKLPLSHGEREAALLLAQVKTPLAPFTVKQAVAVLRRVLDAGAPDRLQVLVFDAVETYDEASTEAVRELCALKSQRVLVTAFSTPEHGDHAFPDFLPLPLQPLSSADVGRWLAAFLGHAAPRELAVGLEARAKGLPGLLVDWTLLAAERGLLRPRGAGLALEGVLPALAPEELLPARLVAVGARVARLVEATAALGDAADTATLARVLPGVTPSTWQRLQATRLVVSAGGSRLKVAGPVLEVEALRAPTARRPALWQRLVAVLGETVKRAPLQWLRVARLVAAVSSPSRAAQAWRQAAEQALALRSPLGLLHALTGWAEAVERQTEGDSTETARLRLELLARAASNAFAVRDVERARALVEAADDLARREQVGVPEHFLAAARLQRAQGHRELAAEALSRALVLAGQGPVAALGLAELADLKEAEGDLAAAAQALEQAVQLSDAAAPLAAWHGEVDFRARLETRLGAVLLSLKDGNAKAWLTSALQRWRALGAKAYEARVLANLGALAVGERKLADAAAFFSQAVTTAEAAGDFVFEAKQLVSLAKVQARAGDKRAAKTADAARRRAAAMGWDDGVTIAEAMVKGG